MSQDQVIAIARDALMTIVLVSAPVLLASLGVGIVISLVQTMTQINEATLTFVPKILTVFAVLALAGPWMMSEVTGFATRMLVSLGQYGR